VDRFSVFQNQNFTVGEVIGISAGVPEMNAA
jgi:hypothetical protein